MIQIIDCEQKSPEWYAARAGIPTASMFKTVMANGKDGSKSDTRAIYLHQLAGEIITGEPCENYVSRDMERGTEQEPKAREMYAAMTGVDLVQVGFIRSGSKGASPDSLIGVDGGLEIKSAAAHIQVERLLLDRVPPEHIAQVQGTLWIAEREWWDFMSYCPGMPPLIKTVYRDEKKIREIALAVEIFNAELAQIVEKIRRYGKAA